MISTNYLGQNKRLTMKRKPCPYYEDVPVKSCNAVMEGIKVPTKKEIDRFCLGNYEECSLYINRETNIEREKEVMHVKKGKKVQAKA